MFPLVAPVQCAEHCCYWLAQTKYVWKVLKGFAAAVVAVRVVEYGVDIVVVGVAECMCVERAWAETAGAQFGANIACVGVYIAVCAGAFAEVYVGVGEGILMGFGIDAFPGVLEHGVVAELAADEAEAGLVGFEAGTLVGVFGGRVAAKYHKWKNETEGLE